MTKGKIILVDVGSSRMYLRLASDVIVAEDGSANLTYDRRMDVQLVPTRDQKTGLPSMDTIQMNTGEVLGMSKTSATTLHIPANAMYHLVPMNENSNEYKDLVRAFTDIQLM